jgi:hypothetical protein
VVKRFFERFLYFSLAAGLEVIALRFRGFFEFFKRFPGGVMNGRLATTTLVVDPSAINFPQGFYSLRIR